MSKRRDDKTRRSSKKRKVALVEEYDSDDEYEHVRDPQVDKSRSCPYLDTINRSVLDFDFEKLCSVSLSHLNVYACLVCGKYFQGRGQKSHAYTHSVQINHRVFLNLHTLKFYCLPDNYQIIDSSLEDITYVLKPTFTPELISQLNTNVKLFRAYDGTTYLPGIVGLNNIKANDYCNVLLHAFVHVVALRDYFLEEQNYINIKLKPGIIIGLLAQRFGELNRKMWNPRNFKAHVSPHEMLQSVVLCSKKRFQITEQGDPVEFLAWFLNALHASLGGTKKRNSSVISQTFQGRMKVYSRKVIPLDISEEEERKKLMQTEEFKETSVETPFLFLTLDIPPAPLFKDELEQNIIPQVPLSSLLSKFDGVTEKEYKTYKDSTIKRFELTRLPPYLIICIKRFTKNTFFVEKNRTIVNFPVKNIDFKDMLSSDPAVIAKHPHTTYDLMANVVHDGEPGSGKGTYRVHVLHQASQKWYEIQDLHVADVLPQLITLSEAYIQIWELKKDNNVQPSNAGDSTGKVK
ncbi:ubiquitin carboxyl-terminal hydrolase 39-like [Apostichopus japonicus]|uniref:ubiquitin carboxyl-terminal hydrolase 39-like n=1 Tax=Stichopus japonicus TaxID=307972 RepID=UPI003AB1B8D7